ncbi:MAG TPA: tRNA 2-selenouridine(34) synthase MnmH [Bacteroidales bacterium]|nr:tRNA 2-selenouridine(34) synthase MnmH [Bacteroidales bacterium]
MPEKIRRINADEFLQLAENIPVIDVRSPGEYDHGRIPGSINIPLFSDTQRAMVGAIYTHQGRADAATAGMGMIAPALSEKMRSALDIASDGKLLVYCWRGGMRSESMAWLFSVAGITPFVLEGGYKAYRNLVLSDLSEKRKFIILGGLTGSGKTSILKELEKRGEQMTDLEGIACHKGSAFGALGQKEQPSSEHFANLLYTDLKEMDPEKRIWLEDESKNIGTVFMPDVFFKNLREAPIIALMMPADVRLPRLIEEYAKFPREELLNSVQKISRRLGGDKAREASDALMINDFESAIRIVLEYYDSSYRYGLSRRDKEKVIVIETDTDDIEINTLKILDAAGKLSL